MKLSIVTTIYRGATVVETLVSQLAAAASSLTADYEIIMVDDNSPDNSWQVIKQVCSQNTKAKAIKLSRNFGQQIAISAGMRQATGNYVVIMDGDLQNPPEAIPLIIAKLEAGYDMVYTTSTVRNHWRDELSSKVFWFIMNNLFKVNMIPNQLMMKGFNRKFLDTYNLYDERVRVVAGITHDIGMKHIHISIENKRRTEGKGNYGFLKRFHLMLDIIMAMTNEPLNYLINISLIGVLLTVVVGIKTLASYIIDPHTPPGYMTLLVFISFFGCMTLLILGIIGRYLANIYVEVRQRPPFLVQEFVNLPSK
jgi:polyisoprenyl-phosphate glycosyltransferase